MNNSVLAQTPTVSSAEDDSYAHREGIQFDEEVCTPEGLQLEMTRRKILKKLLARLGAPNSFNPSF